MKDRRTGEPTGVLKDDAVDLVSRLVPEPTRAEKLAALRAAIGEANRLGITSVHSVSPTHEELELLDEIRKEGDLAVRVYASIAVPPTVSEADVLELNKLRDEFPDDPALKLGGVMVDVPVRRAADRACRRAARQTRLARDGADRQRRRCARGSQCVRTRGGSESDSSARPPQSPRREPPQRWTGAHSVRQQLAGGVARSARCHRRRGRGTRRAAQCDRRVYEPRGVCVLRRAAQGHARAGDARGHRDSVERHLRTAPGGAPRDRRDRDHLRRQDRVPTPAGQ